MVINYITELLDILNKKYTYAVLRNYDELPLSFKSKDIDILIERDEFGLLKSDIKKLMDKHDFKTFLINENERFVQLMIMKIIDNKIHFLHLDFFFNFSIYGVQFLETSEILEERVFNGKVYHVSLVHEFLDKYLNTFFLNQNYPKKYTNIYDEVIINHKSKLDKIFKGILNIDNFSYPLDNSINGKKKLYKVFIKNLIKFPVKQSILSFNFFYYYLKSWIKPNGLSISFTGPDGSGKTTILNDISNKLISIHRDVKIIHFRPTIIPRIAEVFNKAGLKKDVDVDYNNPHRGGKTSKLSSFLRLIYYILDYIIGYIKIVLPVLNKRDIVIFDRYYTDIITDSKRSKINLHYKLLFIMRKIVPKLNYNFLISVLPENILKRKQELTKEEILDINEKLDFIMNGNEFTKIENNETSEVAVTNIINFILDKQTKKYSSFFNVK